MASAAVQSPRPTSTYKPASEDGPAENVPVPEMPDEASLKSQQGLEAFIPYWFETVSYSYETGDLEMIRSITGTDCALCEAVFDDIESWTVDGRWIVGGDLRVTKIEDRYAETTSGGYAPYIFFSQEPLFYYSNGALKGESDGIAEPTLWIPEIQYQDGGWQMIDLARPEGGRE
ncbi:DUF6318 family protein [Arthrobacter sp.]|uniref:DUF6318 family protein n=1 Tax=Arthrobacter sp. TaxID=1667 RepID=UPI003398D580